jgi:hypothetical protein
VCILIQINQAHVRLESNNRHLYVDGTWIDWCVWRVRVGACRDHAELLVRALSMKGPVRRQSRLEAFRQQVSGSGSSQRLAGGHR